MTSGATWDKTWSETYRGGAAMSEQARKWARDDDRGHEWHERWGEDYACGSDGTDRTIKWTDKWTEEMGDPYLADDGATRRECVNRFGDKWREAFQEGRGEKRGTTWSQGRDGAYHREWGEDHWGDGQVRRFGHSNTGETWDQVEIMDTCYEPTPHVTMDIALRNSHRLRTMPVRSRDDMGEQGGGGGLEDL